MRRTVITACGCVDEGGFGNARSWTPWPGGVPRLRWRTFSDQPFDRFGRLDLLCKYAVAAVEMLELPPFTEGESRPDLALLLGSDNGSLDTDVKFVRSIHEPGGASPTLFSYTLPSTALGEIAIRHHITGPSACVMAGPESGPLALWEGMAWVAEGDVGGCICVGCDAVSASVADAPSAHAYAFLVADEAAVATQGNAPLARLALSPAPDGKIDRPQRPLRQLFRLLASGGGKAPGAALYLPAPATLNVLQVMTVSNLNGRSDGRAG